VWGKAGGLFMKNKPLSYVVFGISFVLVSVIAFVIPTHKTETFWVTYLFTVIAFAMQVIAWKTTVREDSLNNKFLGIPIVYLGTTYLVIQIIALAIFTAVPFAPTWSAIIVCILIFGIAAICIISCRVGQDKIRQTEGRSKEKTSFIRKLQAEIELLAEAESDQEVKVALTKLAEQVKYSDPVSCDALAEIEGKLLSAVEQLRVVQNKTVVIERIVLLLSERNMKCKTLK
jgi:hypothetical protein